MLPRHIRAWSTYKDVHLHWFYYLSLSLSLSLSLTHTHTHKHTHTHTHTQTHTHTNTHITHLLVMGWYNEKKCALLNYALPMIRKFIIECILYF